LRVALFAKEKDREDHIIGGLIEGLGHPEDSVIRTFLIRGDSDSGEGISIHHR